MSDESRRVLDLLSQGKITVDEADRLLAAIGSASGGSTATGTATADKGASTGEAPPKYLRITVTKSGSWPGDDGEQPRRASMWRGHVGGGRNREVSIRVPVALVRNGMRLGAMIPGLAGGGMQTRLRERGVEVDLSKLDPAMIDQLVSEFGEMNIDVTSERGGKAQIRITCE
jgi:hypothetical protein